MAIGCWRCASKAPRRAIIGRYERSEITPSIEVAKKLADAFGVILDYLVDDNKELPNILQNKAMLARWRDINALEPAEQERICP